MLLSPKLQALDAQLVRAAKSVKVLSAISWRAPVIETIALEYKSGRRRMPVIDKPKPIAAGVMEALLDVEAKADAQDPAGLFLKRTAHSYRLLGELIAAAQTPRFYEISRRLYGGPDGRLAGAELTHEEAALKLMKSASALHVESLCNDCGAESSITSEVAAEMLRTQSAGVFEKPIRVVVDADLNAKAAASSSRVRLRANTLFTHNDVQQLLQHEIFIHSLTAKNGRDHQPLKTFGLGAPRTTATQEGLATFAELVTGSIDLARLWRIALRIHAITLAESGAEFFELVDVLVELGESPREAILSCARIYRGGDVRGRYVFTKDTVYLKGLFAVFTFLRKAIARHELSLITGLFVGRLTLGDVTDLQSCVESGVVAPPRYMPPWAQNIGSLSGFLVVSGLIDHIALRDVTLDEIEDVVAQR